MLVVLALLVVFRFVNPPFTPTILAHKLSGGEVDQRWVPLSRISPRLMQAVISSEDARFCLHGGVDLGALKAALRDYTAGSDLLHMAYVFTLLASLFVGMAVHQEH